MTLIDKLMEIDHLIHSDGGVAFLKIRMMLEDVEKEIEKNNPHAIQFSLELDHILGFLKKAAEIRF